MAANECIPFYEPGARITVEADAAVTGKRFVHVHATQQPGFAGLTTDLSGGNVVVRHASAHGMATGVSSHDIASGDKGTMITGGVLPITADGAITYGQKLAVGANGKAKTAVAEDVVVGLALASVSDGEDCPVLFLGSSAAGGGLDIVEQTHIADATITAANTTAISAAAGEATAADLTLTQALEVEFSKAVTDLGTLATKVNAILDALEANGILATS